MRRRAFTLIELMVVTTVLVLVAGLITPNLVAIKQGRDRDEVYASVLRLVQRGRESAIRDGRNYELTVSGGNARSSSSGTRRSRRATIPGRRRSARSRRRRTWTGSPCPSDISLGDLQLGGKDSNASDFTMHFYPDGHSEGGGLELVYNGSKRNVAVTNRGLATLTEGGLPTANANDWEAGQYVHVLLGADRRRRRGFTLLEALAAVVLLGIGIVAAMGANAQIIHNEDRARSIERMQRLAQEKLAELVATGQATVSTSGDFSDENVSERDLHARGQHVGNHRPELRLAHR